MEPELHKSVVDLGFAIVPDILGNDQIDRLADELSRPSLRRSRAGIRHLLAMEAVATLASHRTIFELVTPLLGDGAIPFRATLFEKSPVSNWLIVWHQDIALPVTEKRDRPGWGPWSIKDGVNYAHAPSHVLERVLAVRVHLDESSLENGPLRLLPGTHKTGVLTDDEVHARVLSVRPAECVVPKGGVLLMRPLLVHSSSKSVSNTPRRVLHIEYASSRSIDEEMELAIT